MRKVSLVFSEEIHGAGLTEPQEGLFALLWPELERVEVVHEELIAALVTEERHLVLGLCDEALPLTKGFLAHSGLVDQCVSEVLHLLMSLFDVTRKDLMDEPNC